MHILDLPSPFNLKFLVKSFHITTFLKGNKVNGIRWPYMIMTLVSTCGEALHKWYQSNNPVNYPIGLVCYVFDHCCDIVKYMLIWLHIYID